MIAPPQRLWRVLVLLLPGVLFAETPGRPETLHYGIEWRMINAGTARLTTTPNAAGQQVQLQLLSAGLVSRLYKVNDFYTAVQSEKLCAQDAHLQAEEGSRKRDTTIAWRGTRSHYVERDLLKNTTALEKDLDVPACVLEVTGALQRLRNERIEPGQTFTYPLTDGKKFVQARIEAQERETVKTPAGQFKTIRYEAFLFNDVLFKRSARLLIWISDDARRLPVQFQVRMRLYIGTVTLQLDKVEP